MKNFAKRNIFIAWSLIPILGLVGCDKESKKDSAQDSPKAPDEELDTTMVPVAQADKGKFSVFITSNEKTARFKCSMVPESQKALPVTNWSDCQANWTVDVAPGQSYVLRAKALGQDGREDTSPAEYVAAAPALVPPAPGNQPAGNGQGSQPKPRERLTVRTMILNKASIPAEVNEEELEVNFGFEADGIDPSQIVYECKSQKDITYRSCPDKDRFKFSKLQHGGEYRLKVRAIIAGDKVPSESIEDEIVFKVNLTGGFTIANENEIANKTLNQDTEILLPKAGRSLKCSLTKEGQTGAREVDCRDKFPLKIRELGQGSFQFVVKDQGREEKSLAFCVIECSRGDLGQPGQGPGAPGIPGNGPVGAPPVGAPPGGVGGGGGVIGGGVIGGGGVVGAPYPEANFQTYQIGSFYGFAVSPGMHVVQYASTKNHAEKLNYYSVTNDPFAIGNYNCSGVVDRILTFLSPSKVPYTYCHSTPMREEFKFFTEGRLAFNHIEVATDANIVEKNPFLHERIIINVFDQDYEYMLNRGKFSSLCAENVNARGRVTKSPLVPVIDRNFWGTWTNAQIFACWGQFAEGPGLPTLDQTGGWWIGAFYISSNDNLPAFECYKNNWSYDMGANDYGANYGPVSPQWCHDYKNPSLIEVVYMTKKPFQQDYLFMQELQVKFRGVLQELRPRL